MRMVLDGSSALEGIINLDASQNNIMITQLEVWT